MEQTQKRMPPRNARLLTLLLGCGCLAAVLCSLPAAAGLKFAAARSLAGDSNHEPAWSPDGSQIAFSSERDGSGDIYVMQSDGTHVVRLTNSFYSFKFFSRSQSPAWSPDGRRLVFVSNRKSAGDIYLMESDGSQVVRLTDSRASGRHSSAEPDWSPDGRQIVFTSQLGNYDYGLPEEGGFELTVDLFVIGVDGSGLVQLTDLGGLARSPQWSPDGSQIAFSLFKGGSADIYLIDADGGDLRQVTDDSTIETDLDWSPDGRRLTFSAGDIFHNNIFVMDLDGTGLQQLTRSRGIGDSSPCWSPDGERILFESKDSDTRLNQIFSIAPDGSHPKQLTGR